MITVAIAIMLGILAGLFLPYNLSNDTLPYVAVALLAALDTIFGGIWSNLEKRFNVGMFMTGLVSNALLAILFTFMGNKLGIDLSLAVVVVFGVRIFNNLSNIRRYLFERYARGKNIRLKRIEAAAAEEETEIDE
ncbi:MAG: small basic family protein [Clostridia bacterium]|nr:small basic family protein [Clostridia bacterium]